MTAGDLHDDRFRSLAATYPNPCQRQRKSTGRIYVQDYVLFLRAAGGKIAFLREYFDPVRAAKALDTPILGLES
jgi:hypothetical protein